MGTSKSYGGPGNNSPLLPPWADDTSPIPTPDGSPQAPNPVNPSAPSTNPTPATPAGIPQSANWSTARRQFGSFVRGGGTGSLGKSLGSYTRSKGGARNASRSARAGRASTAKLGGFLSNVARGGIGVATEALGLASAIIGMPVALALGTILDAIAPDGATPDDNAARYAINATLDEMYERFELGEGDLTRLDAIDASTGKELIALSVASYIYEKFLQDLQYSFEEGNIPVDDVVRLEREVKSYIQEKVNQELVQQDIDVLSINWSGNQGRQFCEDIYSQAYSLLEDRQ